MTSKKEVKERIRRNILFGDIDEPGLIVFRDPDTGELMIGTIALYKARFVAYEISKEDAKKLIKILEDYIKETKK